MRHIGYGIVVLTTGLALGGCVERTLLFTSDPAGARLTVNGKDVGLTPVRIPYVHNQRFEYRVEKAGYRSAAGDVKTPTTWDSVPGPDLIAENLYPGVIRRRTERHVVLEPLPRARSRAELEATLRQAEALRTRAETENGGPGVAPPTRPGRIPPPVSPTGTPPAPNASQGTPPTSR